GEVMLVGRRDDQVKVRGHRVELAQVAAALEALPRVRAAAVLPVSALETTRLAAFVSGPRDLDPETIRASLAARLPAHMVPGEVIRLDVLPLSPNGKVRRDLLEAELAAQSSARKPTAATALARVDASIVVRAVAIFLVVAGHLQLFRYGGGATTALFLVSGYLFGGLQLAEVYARRTAQPVIRWLLRLLTPTLV